jgi:hypothetical protein
MMKWLIAAMFLFTSALSDYGTATARQSDGDDGEPRPPTVIDISAEPGSPRLGETFDLVFTTPDAGGLYYLEAEIGINPQVFELTDLQPGGLFGQDVLYVGDYNAANRIGFSITSTSGELSGAGVLFTLRFSIPDAAPAGSYTLGILNLQARSTGGEILETEHPLTVPAEVRSYISWANLQSPAVASVEYGFSVNVEARVVVPDVTTVSGQNDDIAAWIGVSAENTDPSLWPESAWTEAGYIQRTGNAHVYRNAVGSDLPSGVWYLASRFSYQDDGFFYGGYSDEGGGFWDGTTNVSGVLTVNEPGKMVVAEWNFNDDSRKASRAIFANLQNEFSLVGANFTGFVTGSPGRAANSNGWNGNDPEVEKYWLAGFTTTGLHDLQLSYKMKSSGTGPRDFMLQAGTDNENWTDLLDEPLRLTENFNHTSIIDFQLPAALHDSPQIWLRWLLVSDRRVSESDDPVSATGSSQIDEVKITGRPLVPQFPTVWPGDTNNDGVVDETDVLPLGFYWRASGPARAVTGQAWQGAAAVGWIPLNATFADTDGSGTVNQSDLLAIGLNFGLGQGDAGLPGNAVAAIDADDAGDLLTAVNELQSGKTGQNQIASGEGRGGPKPVSFPEIGQGKMLEIGLSLPDAKRSDILGVSYSFEVLDGPEAGMEIHNPHPGDWARDGYSPATMLRFRQTSGSRTSGAIVYKGYADPDEAGRLLTLRIAAVSDWNTGLTLGNFRISIIDVDGKITRIEDVSATYEVVTATGLPVAEGIPSRVELHQNYPNPFNPATVIGFALPEASGISIELYSVTGQRVATIAEGYYQAGNHAISFDASHLSSGVYIYRLKTGQAVVTKKMTLLK